MDDARREPVRRSSSAAPRTRRRGRRRPHERATMTGVRLATVDLPDFGVPVERPELPVALYAERVERLRARAAEAGFDRLVVYADREHSANLSFLTGFDPRFEEAMLVLGPTGTPAILLGNECWGMAGAAPLPMERHRYQDFSLPSQPRDRSLPLAEILAGEGIGAREPGRRRRLEGLRPARPDRAARVHRRRAARARRADRPRRERQRAAHRPGRRPADHQRRRPARDVRVGVVRDVERRPAAAPRAPPGPARVRGRRRCWAGTGCRCRAT